MINVRELRIGSYISFNECVYSVNSILKQEGGEYQINAINNQKNVINVSPNDCNPIELNEQILCKIGFEPLRDSGLMKLNVFDFLKILAIVRNDDDVNSPQIAISVTQMYPFEEDNIQSIEGREFLPIKYLHQLQNLYNSLKDSELF